jgi:hypothetical protein
MTVMTGRLTELLAPTIVALALVAGCGRDDGAAARDGVASATAAPTSIPSPCPAPALTPTYLPNGVEPTDSQPIFGMPDRLRTWTKDDVLVQLGEGFSGDHGEESRLKQVSVRGTAYANLLAHEDPNDGSQVVSVDWEEQTRCGRKQYIVVTKRLSEDETLKIAQSLEGDTD